jgi:peptidylprolyl isomerase
MTGMYYLTTISGGNVMTDKKELAYLDLKDGRVTIELRPDLAPKHVARLKELISSGYYDGLKFHRVIPGFMAQTGCPEGSGMGGSGQKIKAEFTDAPYLRGTCGMARAGSPDSGDSQFFICFVPTPFLEGDYTVWGQVIDGMEHVDNIAPGEPPRKPDTIVKFSLAS